MANLTLRLVKGSPLTYTEVDNNFTALNDATGHFKNALINGNFDIWQRGTSIASSGSVSGPYTADRWLSGASNGAATITRQAFTVGQTDVPGEPKYFFRHDRTSAATSTSFVIQQRVESVRTFAGKTVTFSIWAKVASGTKSMVPRVLQHFGTGGSPSSDVSTTISAITLTTSWQQFDMEFSIPSISGKTIGSDNNDYLAVILAETSSFSTFTADFAQAQVEKGDEVTEFERRPIGTELALCQRYFQKTYNIDTPPGTINVVGASTEFTSVSDTVIRPLFRTLAVPMRISPTITWYSVTTGASGNIRVDAADVAVSTTNNVGQSAYGYPIVSTTVSDGAVVSAHITAAAEL